MFNPLARMVGERSAVRPLIGAVFAFGTVCVTHALGVAWPGPIAPWQEVENRRMTLRLSSCRQLKPN
jgi:hypothetical protein